MKTLAIAKSYETKLVHMCVLIQIALQKLKSIKSNVCDQESFKIDKLLTHILSIFT